ESVETMNREDKKKRTGSLFYLKLMASSSSFDAYKICHASCFFFLLEFSMSDEIKNQSDDINEENNQEDELSEEIIRKLSMNEEEEEEEENELPLSTPNGRETPSAASFSDVII